MTCRSTIQFHAVHDGRLASAAGSSILPLRSLMLALRSLCWKLMTASVRSMSACETHAVGCSRPSLARRRPRALPGFLVEENM